MCRVFSIFATQENRPVVISRPGSSVGIIKEEFSISGFSYKGDDIHPAFSIDRPVYASSCLIHAVGGHAQLYGQAHAPADLVSGQLTCR